MAESENSFDSLCNRAVNAFLQTVVVIDNEASLTSDISGDHAKSIPLAASRKRASAPGMAAPGKEVSSEPRKSTPSTSEIGGHKLELNQVSQAFARQGLTCGVYLPTETDPADQGELVNATVRAISPTDACVLDWQLRKGDSRPATEAIIKVLDTDKSEGGRLRLVLVYTAEKLDDASPALERALVGKGYEVKVDSINEAPVITGDHFRIVFINKPTMGKNPADDPAVVPWDGLPQRIIEEFTILARGLLRAFALESIAAVRRDIHRILAQFDEELDPVYAGDRATKPDPDDAGRLMVEVLQSELSLSIAASQAEQRVLGVESCLLWLHSRADRCVDKEIKPIKMESLQKRFFVISCGFQDRARRAGNQVDHGHERLRVAISPSSGTRRLEYAIQAFQSRIGIG